MIVTRVPLRVSFLGGGTDFPWFFNQGKGAVISAAIDEYIYLSVLSSYDRKTFYLKYSDYEKTEDISRIRHPIIRAVFADYLPSPLDLSVMAEIPAGNGLASSSAFTVGLVAAIRDYLGLASSPAKLAEEAIRFELEVLKRPIGVQDQLGSAYPGVNLHQFSKQGISDPISLASDSLGFPFSLVLVKVGGFRRDASKMTEAQKKFVEDHPIQIKNLERLADLTLRAAENYQSDPESLSDYVREGWALKKLTNPNASSAEIESLQAKLMSAGSRAEKLLGAGGSGFMLAMFERQEKARLKSQLERNDILNSRIIEVSWGGCEVFRF